MHVLHAASMVVPRPWIEKYGLLKTLLKSSTILGETDLKRASSRKVHRMLHNAVSVVERHEKESILNTHFSQALFNFSTYGFRRSEEVGGLRWTWRNLFNRKLFSREGLWYSVRLSASNLAQAFITLYVIIEGSRLVKHVNQNFDSDSAKAEVEKVVERMINGNVDEDLVDSLAGQMSTLVASFVTSSQSEALSLNCTGVSETASSLVLDYCNSDNGYWQCDNSMGVNYLCGLVNDPSGVSELQTLGLLNASGLDGESLMALSRTMLQESVDQTIDSLYPTHKYMVTIPMIVAVCMATLCALYLTLSYASSVTSTILKLRCGIIPSLADPEKFSRMRQAPDTVSLLTGSLFWGCLGSSILVGGSFGVIVFLFLWQGSVYFAQRVTALAIGITVITLIRLMLVNCCRRSYYRAFYRRKPAAANISLLALEWANFALSAGFILIRAIKLILVAGFSIGRVDRPFLAEGIGRLGPIELDGYPTIHTRDLLLNEAHRHPYLELLGTMYLMKLRYSDHFGKTAGSCWRLIFVYAIFPWLHKYRVMARPKLFVDATTASSHPESDLRNKSLTFVSLRNMFSSFEEEEGEIQPSLVNSSLRNQETVRRLSNIDETEKNNDNTEDGRNVDLDASTREVAEKRTILALEEKVAQLEAEIERLRQGSVGTDNDTSSSFASAQNLCQTLI